MDAGHEPDKGQVSRRSFSVQRQLLERDVELSALEGLIDASSRGGRLLAIEGPPGIGKTSLIAEAKALAQEAGMLVLAARGSELEQPFSYGIVRQLLEPHLASLDDETRTAATSGAAALATPLFDPARFAADATTDSTLAYAHGLYWLTANLAARSPLLLAVDDLQWCDLPSLRFLAYLLPRLEGLDVVIVVALRPEQGDDAGLLAQVLSDPLATIVGPAPLSAGATTQLLRTGPSPDADDAFCVACWDITGGNPLLVRELAHVIRDEGLVPVKASIGRLRALAAPAGSRVASSRLSRLPREAIALAEAVAILGDDADPHQAAALAGLDEAATADAIAALARVDVLRPQPPLAFVHPLICAAVYETLPPLAREKGHVNAARLLTGAGVDPERIAASLIRTSPGKGSDLI